MKISTVLHTSAYHTFKKSKKNKFQNLFYVPRSKAKAISFYFRAFFNKRPVLINLHLNKSPKSKWTLFFHLVIVSESLFCCWKHYEKAIVKFIKNGHWTYLKMLSKSIKVPLLIKFSLLSYFHWYIFPFYIENF